MTVIIKNKSVKPRKLHNAPAVLLRRWFQVVYFPQFGSNVSVSLFAGHLVLIVISDTSLATFSFDLEHIRNVNLMWSMVRYFTFFMSFVSLMTFGVFYAVAVADIPMDNPV